MKLHRIRKRLDELRLDGLLLTSKANIRYVSGFRGDSASILITENRAFFFTNFLYIQQARKEVTASSIKVTAASSIAELLKKRKLRRLGFEQNHLSFSGYKTLKWKIGGASLVPTDGIVEELRAVKSKEEKSYIRTAGRLADKALKHAFALLRPGRTEQDAVSEIEYFIRKNLRAEPSFPIIVLFGAHCALPHGQAGRKRLKKAEPVLIDLGVNWKGYCSDLTRTVFFTKMKPALRKMRAAVLSARAEAISAVRAGLPACELDRTARAVIEKAGYGKFFGHGLGHGVGLDVHEAPVISGRSRQILQEDMVFTIEPGVYIPGTGGVRIEDMVILSKRGSEVLSKHPSIIEL